MKIEVKDKDTGKNIKESDIEIPKAPKPKDEEKKPKTKRTNSRRHHAPLKIIIPVAAIIGIIIGVCYAIFLSSITKSKLIGVWVKEHDIWTYEFKEDGTGTYGIGFGKPISFHYVDNGDSVTITYDKKGNQKTIEYRSEDENTLILKDYFDIDQTYRRKGSEDNSNEDSSGQPEDS